MEIFSLERRLNILNALTLSTTWLFSFFSQCNDKYSPMFDFKSKDGVLGIRTRDRRMVGTDESTELCPPSYSVSPYFNVMYSSIANNIGKKSYKQIWRNFATWATCQMV